MGSQAPEELKGRLMAMAAGAKRTREWTWTPRIAAVAAAAIVLAALTMLLWPASASARTFQRVVDATNHTKTFSIAVDEPGKRAGNHVRIVGAGPRVQIRTDDGGCAQVDGGKLSVYDPKQNCLTVLNIGGMVDPKALGQIIEEGIGEGLKQYDVKKMLGEFKARYGEENARVSDTFAENGREVYTIEFQDQKGSSGAKITVDAGTSLPTRIQVHEDRGSNVDLRMEFGVDVQIRPIEEMVPKDATRQEFDLGELLKNGGALMGVMSQFGQGFGKDGHGPDPDQLRKLKDLGEQLKGQLPGR